MKRKSFILGAVAALCIMLLTSALSYADIVNTSTGVPYATLKKAVNAADPGDTLRFDPGLYAIGTVKVKKNLNITCAVPGTVTVNGQLKLTDKSNGATISNLTFARNTGKKGVIQGKNANNINLLDNTFNESRLGISGSKCDNWNVIGNHFNNATTAMAVSEGSVWTCTANVFAVGAEGIRAVGTSVMDVSNNTFTDVDLPVYFEQVFEGLLNGNSITNSVQAITNWDGDGWVVTNNTITNLRTNGGGGIGILIGSKLPIGASSNYVGLTRLGVAGPNVIGGTFTLAPVDAGKSVGAGIALVAIKERNPDPIVNSNIVQNNIVALGGPQTVGGNFSVCGIILNEIKYQGRNIVDSLLPFCFIQENEITFNDLDGTDIILAERPVGISTGQGVPGCPGNIVQGNAIAGILSSEVDALPVLTVSPL